MHKVVTFCLAFEKRIIYRCVIIICHENQLYVMKNNHKNNFCFTCKTTIAIRMLKIYRFCIGSVIPCYNFNYDVICVARDIDI